MQGVLGVIRRKSNTVRVGGISIGGDAPISVQSMTKTYTTDVEATRRQIDALADAGCDIVRVAVPDIEAARAFAKIKKLLSVPLVADIHYNYKLALLALEGGADKLRINPGNIGAPDRVRAVARAAKERGVPIRVGVNAGSLDRTVLDKYGGRTPEAMVETALREVSLLEGEGFTDIVISLKASDVVTCINAYRIAAGRTPYPFHVGITEAGPPWSGAIRSATGIGAILAGGIGDTIRVSLTGDPVLEVRVGITILRAFGLRRDGIQLISCPTCGRCQVDLARIVAEVEARLEDVRGNLKVAVMGCSVNGPGEAKEADVGIAAGKGSGILFVKGEAVARLSEDEFVRRLVSEVKTMVEDPGKTNREVFQDEGCRDHPRV